MRMQLDLLHRRKAANRGRWEAEWVNGKGLSKIQPFSDPARMAARLFEEEYSKEVSDLDESVGPVIGRWSHAHAGREWHTEEWAIPMHLAKDIRGVHFVYTGGYATLLIKSAAIIADGKEVAIDRHDGKACGAPSKNFYKIAIPEGLQVNNSCILRAEIKGTSASSYGSIRAVTKQGVEDEK